MLRRKTVVIIAMGAVASSLIPFWRIALAPIYHRWAYEHSRALASSLLPPPLDGARMAALRGWAKLHAFLSETSTRHVIIDARYGTSPLCGATASSAIGPLAEI